MNFKTIELFLLQLEEAFSKSRSNIYSDKKKEDHFLELYNLFEAIKKTDYRAFDKKNLINHFEILNYIFTGLEYLDNSTLNIIPYEIISCLEYALDDWVDKDKFIIVTSLSNKNLDFYFKSNFSDEFFNLLNSYITTLYSLKITHRLIRISLPKVLSRDYLSCVVLYHELGHFVDLELNLSIKLFLNKFRVYQPRNNHEQMFLSHKMEYFADLFAAQYINDASSLFLNHISSETPDSISHPATLKRLNVVNNFLNGVNCPELNEFNSVLSATGSKILKIRYSIIDKDKSNFLKLVPQVISDESQLHYIFKLGWDFWENSESNFLSTFQPRQKYHIINNLIEKSISNYTITKKWQTISSLPK